MHSILFRIKIFKKSVGIVKSCWYYSNYEKDIYYRFYNFINRSGMRGI